MFTISRSLFLIIVLYPVQSLWAGTIQTSYQFIGSAKNAAIKNGFLTADGVASGSLGGVGGVVFDTHNYINLTTLQNFGTFTMLLPDGSTAFGNLHEDDVKVSLKTFSGPFTQVLTFTGGTDELAGVSGILTGGGNIYPTYYTTSGEGALTGPGLVASPEPTSLFLFATGIAVTCLGLSKRAATRSSFIGDRKWGNGPINRNLRNAMTGIGPGRNWTLHITEPAD